MVSASHTYIEETLKLYPYTETIAQNPIFLFEYTGIKKKMKRCSKIYLKDQDGNITNLEMISGAGKNLAVYGHNYAHQTRYVILRAEKPLPLNAEVSMFIENTNGDGKINKWLHNLRNRTWKVKNELDQTPPTFKSELIGQYFGSFIGSGSWGHSLHFELKCEDNNPYLTKYPENFTQEQQLKYPRKSQMMIEIRDLSDTGKRYIVPLMGGEFVLGTGNRFPNFLLPKSVEKDKDCVYEARLIDFSGNISEPKLIKFKMIKAEPAKQKVMTSPGVYKVVTSGMCQQIRGVEELTIDGSNWVNVSGRNNCTFFEVYFEKNVLDEFRKKHQGITTKEVNDFLSQKKKLVVEDKTHIGSIEQNKPNPFSSKTSVEYYLSPEVYIGAIKITDVLGTDVLSVVLDKKGSNRIEIKADELPPGIYLYTLMADGVAIDIKKMLVE